MIRIGKIEKTFSDGKARVTAPVEIDGKIYPLWFEVADRFSDFLCADRCDAFVAGLFPLALKARQDIAFEMPITWQLKDGLEHDFIDVLCQHQKDLYRVRLIGEVCDPIRKSEDVIGTGVSCGVDSLFTIKRRLVDSCTDRKRYLLLNNMTDEDGDRQARFECLRENATSLAAELGIPLIISDANYSSGEIPGLMAESRTTYCNLFCVLSLQGLFTRYFVASGGPVGDFSLYLQNGFWGTDCSDYDLLTLSACSTSSLKFIVDGLEDRVKKMQALVDWPLAWNHLDVCFRHADGNRGNGTNDCPKCMHTVVEILAQGGLPVLERFKNVFDVDYVRTHMEEYLADIMRIRLHGHEYGRELWPKCHVAGFTAKDYPMAVLIVVRKMLKKVLRLGKTQIGQFSPRG